MKQQEKLELNPGRTSMARFPGRAIIIAMLVAAPWMLGSIAGWSQALLCLCGLVALGFWWLEVAVLRPKQIIMPLSVLPILLGVGLGIIHFAPLPDSVAQTLGAGHAYQQWESMATATEMDQVMVDRMIDQGITNPSQLLNSPTKSISIDPNATRLMTAQLVLAAICYLLGAHFFHDRKSLIWLCIFLTINGVAISLFGIVQKMAGEQGMIFGVIPVTGGLFGPYVNRNNASGLLVMCLAAAVMLTVTAFRDENERGSSRGQDLWYSFLEAIHELNAAKLACVFSIVFIVAGVVVSLSRGGTLAVLAGGVFTFLVLGINSKDSRQGSLVYLFAAVIMGGALVGWLGFGEKILERFEDADRTEIMQDARVENWRDTSQLVPEQWLLGSGLSTYQHVHRPYRTTTEQALYYFAENQYFQALIDGGLIGLLLLLVMLGWSIYFVRSLILAKHFLGGFAAAVFGGFAIASQMVSGFFDFGLYMPANMVTFAVVMGALAGVAQGHAARSRSSKSHHRSRFRFASLGFGRIGVAVMLLLFSGGILSLFQFYRLANIQAECLKSKSLLEAKWNADISAVEENLLGLSQLSSVRPDIDVQKAIAELSVAKFRLTKFQQIIGAQESISDEQALDVWNRTNPVASALFLRQQKEVNPNNDVREIAFRNDKDLKNDMLTGYKALMKGRSVSPFSAEVHLRLAELGNILTDSDPNEHLQRVLAISSVNPSYQMLAGVYMLRQLGFDSSAEGYEPAVAHLRKAIELDSRMASQMEPMVVQRNVMGVWVYGLRPEEYAEYVLLDNPYFLYRFLSNRTYANYFSQYSEAKERVIGMAMDSISSDAQIQYWEFRDSLAVARLAAMVEDWERSAEFAEVASSKGLFPNEAVYVRLEALIEMGKVSEAKLQLSGLPKKKIQEYEKKLAAKQAEKSSAEPFYK